MRRRSSPGRSSPGMCVTLPHDSVPLRFRSARRACRFGPESRRPRGPRALHAPWQPSAGDLPCAMAAPPVLGVDARYVLTADAARPRRPRRAGSSAAPIARRWPSRHRPRSTFRADTCRDLRANQPLALGSTARDPQRLGAIDREIAGHASISGAVSTLRMCRPHRAQPPARPPPSRSGPSSPETPERADARPGQRSHETLVGETRQRHPQAIDVVVRA